MTKDRLTQVIDDIQNDNHRAHQAAEEVAARHVEDQSQIDHIPDPDQLHNDLTKRYRNKFIDNSDAIDHHLQRAKKPGGIMEL